MNQGSLPGAVLFDLDGTLLDTAPDMVASLTQVCEEEGVSAVPYELAHRHVSNGAIGLLRLAFDVSDEPLVARIHPRFLEVYAARIADETSLFEGMDEVLISLEAAGIAWGVVTNKPGFLTDPLLRALKLYERCASVVSGDTLPQRKPEPEPVLHGLQPTRVQPELAVYVGDADRDIEAGRRAGLVTVAAAWGYITEDDDIHRWGADHLADTPRDLLTLLSIPAAT